MSTWIADVAEEIVVRVKIATVIAYNSIPKCVLAYVLQLGKLVLNVMCWDFRALF
jgi:hypothetical protein